MKAESLHFWTEAKSRAAPHRITGEKPARTPWPVAVLGVALENTSLAGALNRVADALTARLPLRVELATCGGLVRAQRDAALRQRLIEADLVLCDSAAVVCAARWLGNPLRERIRASDFVRELAARAAECGWRIFVLGSRLEEVAALSALLRVDETVRIAGSHAGVAGAAFDEAEAARHVQAAQPDVLLVASDEPQVHAWAASRHRRLGIHVCIHVSGTRSFAAADGAGWRRWAGRLRHVFAVAHHVWAQRRLPTAPPVIAPPPIVRSIDEWVDLEAGESLTRAVFDRAPDAWRCEQSRTSHWTVDLSRVRAIDATGIALLARYRAACRRAGRHFVLIAPSGIVRRALGSARLLDCFEVAATLRDARQLVPRSGSAVVAGVTRSLAWCGEIIAANAGDVWEMTSEYIRTFVANGATLVVIDLARLRFIDSAGASLMLRVKRWCREIQAQVVFTHPQVHVQSVLRLTAADLLVLEGGQ